MREYGKSKRELFGLKELIALLTIVGMIGGGIAASLAVIRGAVAEHSKHPHESSVVAAKRQVHNHRSSRLAIEHPDAASKQALQMIAKDVQSVLQTTKRIEKTQRALWRAMRNGKRLPPAPPR